MVYSDTQQYYVDKLKELLPAVYGTPHACVHTFGCQQNVSDSERIKGMLVQMGYEITEDDTQADFILFNTCAVREHAQDRVYGNVGQTKALKQKRKNMIISLCGCMAQQDIVAEKIKKSYPYVDILFGTQVMHRLPEFIYKRLTGSGRIFENSTDEKNVVEGIPICRDKTVKGWLPVMYGCNNFCTYCIVPYVRGRERSRTSEEIIAEAESMIKAGVKDITLLGQNVNSYGKGLKEDINFAKLLYKINDLDGDFRIRFMTSHPKDCTVELLDAMKNCEKVCRHLHLPFQSGSDRILGLMNRRYTSEKYLSLIKAAKERMPDISLTSDIIVGFPGETYEDFSKTVELVKQVEFNSLFTFIYSPRPNTPAAEMEDPVSREEKGVWFNELLAAQDEIAKRKTADMIGKTVRVLVEEEVDGRFEGHSNGTDAIKFSADGLKLGDFCNVRITDVGQNSFIGTVVND